MNIKQQIDEVVSYLEKEEDVNLANFQRKDPEGLGDTLERVFTKFGITEDVIQKAMGIRGCGCQKRKKFLNKIFPYRKRKNEAPPSKNEGA